MSLRVDLKSQEIRRGFTFDYGWIFVLIAVLVAFVVLYAGGLRLQNAVDQKKQDLKEWQDKVAGFSGIKGKLDELKREIVSLQDQIRQLRELRYDPLRYSILLVRLSKLLPTNMWLGSLSIDPSGNKLLISGSSLEKAGHPPLASIAEFIRNLQNDQDNYFSNVVLQGTTASNKVGSIWTFTMQAGYNIPLIQPEGQATPGPKPLLPSTSLTPAPAGSAPPLNNQPSATPSGAEGSNPAASPGATPLPETQPPSTGEGKP